MMDEHAFKSLKAFIYSLIFFTGFLETPEGNIKALFGLVEIGRASCRERV